MSMGGETWSAWALASAGYVVLASRTADALSQPGDQILTEQLRRSCPASSSISPPRAIVSATTSIWTIPTGTAANTTRSPPPSCMPSRSTDDFAIEGIHAFAVHPGMAATNLARHMSREDVIAVSGQARSRARGDFGIPVRDGYFQRRRAGRRPCRTHLGRGEVRLHPVGDVGVGIVAEEAAVVVLGLGQDVVGDLPVGDEGLELVQRRRRITSGEAADRHYRCVGGQVRESRTRRRTG